MASFEDKEFGTVTVRRSSRSRQVKISLAPNGTLRASLPVYAPIFMVKRLINSSREELRKMTRSQQPEYLFENGMHIGKTHTLFITQSAKTKTSATRSGQRILVTLAASDSLSDAAVVASIRAAIANAMRAEAKSYLPTRLALLASEMSCTYERVRFSHASGRWGSCSSSGTISLNIALMKLPHELIDYVLIHELCHTKQMNHSEKFWSLVAHKDSSYKIHRAALKKHSPTI